MEWMRKRWQRGAALALIIGPYLGTLARALDKLVGWGGSIDFLIARSKSPEWVGRVIALALNPPELLRLACLLAALFLIIRSERARTDRKLAEAGVRPLAAPQGEQVPLGDETPPTHQERGLTGQKHFVANDGAEQGAYDIFPEGLYIGETTVSANELEQEHRIEIAFRFYNASGHSLTIASIQGAVEVGIVVDNSIPDKSKFTLPPAGLLRDRSNLHEIPNLSETMIVLRQWLSENDVNRLKAALGCEAGVQFYFEGLSIIAASILDRTLYAPIPLPGGATLRKRSGLISGRLSILKVPSISLRLC